MQYSIREYLLKVLESYPNTTLTEEKDRKTNIPIYDGEDEKNRTTISISKEMKPYMKGFTQKFW